MTNLEKIQRMSAEELVKEVLNAKSLCVFCAYNDEEKCTEDNDCLEGKMLWLRSEARLLLPKIKAGDLLFYGKESYYVAIAPDKLVTLRGYVVVDLENAIRKDSIIAVKRYMDGGLTTIWGADNGQ